MRTVKTTRYVTPLREGGSLPALVEADDDGTYVLKFRGAGQGPKALIAELLAGEIGRLLGLPVPDIVLVDLPPDLVGAEPDPEIQDLLRASIGINLALDFLPGSITFDPLVPPPPAPDLASAVVWFDAYVTNVDRTVRNTNLLIWHHQLYLIDHGAALYFHHDWKDSHKKALNPFALVREHVLLPFASHLTAADESCRQALSAEKLDALVQHLPEPWILQGFPGDDPDDVRRAYLEYLRTRLEAADRFVEEAVRARALLI